MTKTLITALCCILVLASSSCSKKGCMDNTANNYDPEATQDNGSYNNRLIKPLRFNKPIVCLYFFGSTCKFTRFSFCKYKFATLLMSSRVTFL